MGVCKCSMPKTSAFPKHNETQYKTAGINIIQIRKDETFMKTIIGKGIFGVDYKWDDLTPEEINALFFDDNKFERCGARVITCEPLCLSVENFDGDAWNGFRKEHGKCATHINATNKTKTNVELMGLIGDKMLGRRYCRAYLRG